MARIIPFWGIIICAVMLMYPLVSATPSSFGYNYLDQGARVIDEQNYTINVNNTEHLQGRDTSTLYNYFKGLLDAVYVPYTGATSDVNLNNKTLTNVNELSVGTTTSNYPLTVKSNTGGLATIQAWLADDDEVVLDIAKTATDDGYFSLRDGAQAIKIRLNSNADSYFTGGDVGMGITDPKSTLDVNGSFRLNTPITSKSEMVNSKVYISDINNVLYNMGRRGEVRNISGILYGNSGVTPSTQTQIDNIFDSTWDNAQVCVKAGESVSLNINMTKEFGNNGIVYPGGEIYLTAYFSNNNFTYVNVTLTNRTGSLFYPTSVERITASAVAYQIIKINIPTTMTYANNIKLDLIAGATPTTSCIAQLEWHLSRPSSTPMPIMDKTNTNRVYGDLVFANGSNDIVNYIDATTGDNYITSGELGLGTNNPISTNKGLDIASGGISLVMGADASASTRTNATQKISRMGAAHYLNAEEPVGIFITDSSASSSNLYIGGGTSVFNGITTLKFFTAPNTTMTTGTERMTINSAGNVGIGSTSPTAKLDINGGVQIGNNVSSNATFNSQGLLTLPYQTSGTATPQSALTIGNPNTIANGFGALIKMQGGIAMQKFADTNTIYMFNVWDAVSTGRLIARAYVGSGNYSTGSSFILENNALNGGMAFGVTGPLVTDTTRNAISLAHDYVYFWNETSSTTNPILSIKRDTDRVGIGTSSPSGKLHVIAGSTLAETVLLERGGLTSDIAWTSLRSTATKTTDMGDGFGSLVSFAIKDNASVTNVIGSIGAVRQGTDTTGNLVFQPFTSGTANTRMIITYGGDIKNPLDNGKFIWGAGDDASIYYDGTNLNINPKEVGSGVTNNLGGFTTGNATGNITVDAQGDLKLYGEATQWNDLTFPVNNLRINPVTSKPDEDTNNLFYLFDDSDTETVRGAGQSSHTQKNNTPLYCHIHWLQSATGNVTWQLNYSIRGLGSTSDGWTTVNYTGNLFTYSAGDLEQLSYFPVTTNVTTLSSIFKFKVSRLGGATSDTMVGDAKFESFDCHYEIDSFGSNGEYIK